MKLKRLKQAVILSFAIICYTAVSYSASSRHGSSDKLDFCLVGSFLNAFETSYGKPNVRITVGGQRVSLTKIIEKYSDNSKRNLKIKEKKEKSGLVIAEVIVKCGGNKKYLFECYRRKSGDISFITC